MITLVCLLGFVLVACGQSAPAGPDVRVNYPQGNSGDVRSLSIRVSALWGPTCPDGLDLSVGTSRETVHVAATEPARPEATQTLTGIHAGDRLRVSAACHDAGVTSLTYLEVGVNTSAGEVTLQATAPSTPGGQPAVTHPF